MKSSYCKFIWTVDVMRRYDGQNIFTIAISTHFKKIIELFQDVYSTTSCVVSPAFRLSFPLLFTSWPSFWEK